MYPLLEILYFGGNWLVCIIASSSLWAKELYKNTKQDKENIYEWNQATLNDISLNSVTALYKDKNQK